jgi:hypothetical protein
VTVTFRPSKLQVSEVPTRSHKPEFKLRLESSPPSSSVSEASVSPAAYQYHFKLVVHRCYLSHFSRVPCLATGPRLSQFSVVYIFPCLCFALSDHKLIQNQDRTVPNRGFVTNFQCEFCPYFQNNKKSSI